MKKELVMSLGLALSCLACSKYDDSALYGLLAKLDQRLVAVEEHVKKANEDIKTLKDLVSAASQGKTITEVKKTDEGYDLTFSDKQVISIKMGRDGMDGHSPKISVALDGGVYYWQLDGKWLLDTQGQKVRVSGETGPQGIPGKDGATGPQGIPGKDGATGPQGIPGKDGTIGPQGIPGKDGATGPQGIPGKDGATGPQGIPGKDGAIGPQGIPGLDGKTPKLRINAGKWEVAYGNNDWTPVTVVSSVTSGATTVEGLDLFKNIKETDKEVVITLKSGGTIKLSKQTSTPSNSLQPGEVISNPNNPLNGKNIVWDEFSTDNYKLSADGLSLIKWKNTSTQNLDMNRDSQLSKITFIGNYAFERCRNLKNVHIASSVTRIGSFAFADCISLKSATIPSSVTSIGRAAFIGCDGLTTISIPNSVIDIDGEAFMQCTSLTSINIPSSVTSIGESAFKGCERLTSVNIPSSVTSISRSAFHGCSSLTSINIPSSVTSISRSAFQNCSSLTSINIPNSVTSIGEFAFELCSNLTSVTIPSSVTSIGTGAFGSCSSLTSVTIPSSVTSIGESAFYGCSSLTSITIPSSVTYIYQLAFDGCISLTSVVFKGSNPPRGTKITDMFKHAPNNLKFIIPKGAKSAYIKAGYPEDRLIEQ